VKFLLVRNRRAEVPTDPAFHRVFENGHYVILENASETVREPVCPETGRLMPPE